MSVGSTCTRPLLGLHQLCVLLFVVPETNVMSVRSSQTLTARQHIIIYTTKGDACVCVFAKLDQFLPVRSQFDSNQHVNSVRIATFQSANFGPLLFAFYCPLLFYENKIKNE